MTTEIAPSNTRESRRRPARLRRLLALGIAGMLLLSACGSADADTVAPAESTTSSAAPDEAAESSMGDNGAETIEAATAPSASCASATPGVSTLTVTSGGNDYDVRIYVPSSFDATTPLPLVMDFHGFGSNGEQQAALTGYEDLAEEEGFIVVHPTGVPASGDEQGRNSWESLGTDDPAKDDFAFTNELLDLLIEDYCVDETRVYATGMSGGGLFTSQLVCEMSDRLAAAASVAAIFYSESCDPAEPVPFMAIHGTEDPTAPFDGDLTGTRFEGEAFAELLFSVPIPDQFAQFADAMGCDPEGKRVQTSTDIYTTTYSNCGDGVPLVFYEVTGGGHAWPSSPLAEPDSPVVEQLTELQGYTTFDIDATVDTWAFFEQHTLTAN